MIVHLLKLSAFATYLITPTFASSQTVDIRDVYDVAGTQDYDKRAISRSQMSPIAFLEVQKGGGNSSLAVRAVKPTISDRNVGNMMSDRVNIKRISRITTANKGAIADGVSTPSKVIVFSSDPYRMD